MSGHAAVFRAAGSAAGLAIAFAPVPWLAPAAAVLGGILQMCENVATNRRAIKQLGTRCRTLLEAVRDENLESAPGEMKEVVNLLERLLHSVQEKMHSWLATGRFRQFVLQDDILQDVKLCNEWIDDTLSKLTIKSHAEIHLWQREFAENQKLDHEEVMSYLVNIQNSSDMIMEAQHSQRNEIGALMAMMQGIMANFSVGDRRHTDLSNNLYTMQTTSKILLPVTNLTAGEVRRIGSHPVGGSPAFDIWEGEYLGKEKCAIKVIRGVEVSERTRTRFEREVQIWRDVYEQDRGEYILPFYGICHVDGPYPYMVSPWMRNGDALTYVRKNPSANRKRIVRRIAEGLRLLHTQEPPIAHSDLKAANILVNDIGNPLLADFGLSKVMEDITGMPFTQSRGVSDSYRWFAPELCCYPGVISTRSDIFAFAMTALELFTSEHPFAHIKRTPEVLIRMQQGERPHRPSSPEIVARGLDDVMWNLLTRCWDQEPENRPDIHQVLEVLPLQ